MFEWYKQREQTYTSLLGSVKPLLDMLFFNKGINPWHVEGRVKEYNSFLRKMSRKSIDNPEEIFDLVGLRVICFMLSDVRKVNEVIEQNFRVVEK
ncbi:MAG: RelA/SpoT domain-containing protein, partial [Candidatus Nitrosopolaris sp.]